MSYARAMLDRFIQYRSRHIKSERCKVLKNVDIYFFDGKKYIKLVSTWPCGAFLLVQ